MTSIKYPSFQKFRQVSELTQVAEGNCPRIDVSGLSCITKINHMVNDMEKLLPIIGHIEEIFLRSGMRGLHNY
jgi:acetolactate synthase small subunit